MISLEAVNECEQQASNGTPVTINNESIEPFGSECDDEKIKKKLKREIQDDFQESSFKYPDFTPSNSVVKLENDVKPPPAKRQKQEIEEDPDLKKRRVKNKGKTSHLVITFLNKKYGEKKIGGEDPRGLFKVLARRITHEFHDRNPEVVPKSKEIEQYIDTIFEKHEVVTSETDIDNI